MLSNEKVKPLSFNLENYSQFPSLEILSKFARSEFLRMTK